jgi:hypothetical protein
MKSLILILVLASFLFAGDDTAYVTSTIDSVRWKKATLEISRDPKTLDITLVIDHLAINHVYTDSLVWPRRKQKADSTFFDSAFTAATKYVKKIRK